ncbi:MAG TPA: hypothetical protein VGJ44_01595 [Kribbellaceae bacterium]
MIRTQTDRPAKLLLAAGLGMRQHDQNGVAGIDIAPAHRLHGARCDVRGAVGVTDEPVDMDAGALVVARVACDFVQRTDHRLDRSGQVVGVDELGPELVDREKQVRAGTAQLVDGRR